MEKPTFLLMNAIHHSEGMLFEHKAYFQRKPDLTDCTVYMHKILHKTTLFSFMQSVHFIEPF